MNAQTMELFGTDLIRAIKRHQLDQLFAGRPAFTETQLWERAFQPRGVPFDTLQRVMRILTDILEVDLSCLRARDDFSKELAFLFELDSLADLRIMCALEEEFNIRISDADAERMTTLRDIVVIVHAKITAPSE